MSIVTALIPAAGRGTRMGGVRKQFRQLGGEPLVVRTLRVFEETDAIDHIVVSAPAADVDVLAAALRSHEIHKVRDIVPGGETRQASVAAALNAVPADTGIILVHDAVRPFVPASRICAVVDAARASGAAALAVAATDTLRRGVGSFFTETVDRSDLFRMQTPQAFRYAWFVDAHEAAREAGYEETDDVALIQRTGRRVTIVEGSRLNIKVTTPDDWLLAQAIFDAERRKPASGS